MRSTAIIHLLALYLAGASLCLGQTPTTDWPSVVSRTKSAVVLIETEHGLGSGFLVRQNGTLVTNKHVITGASKIMVTFASGEKYHKAFVLAEDEGRDIAILRVEGTGLPSLPIMNSSQLEVGTDVLLIGAPQGLSHTVSTGIISAYRLLENGTKVIQTTAPASRGSSGGPLLTREGRVIGVLSFSIKGGENLNFAVPYDYIQAMLETLETHSGINPIRTLTKLEPRATVASSGMPKTEEPTRIKLDGTLLVAWRTQKHIENSSYEVFQGIVDDMLLFLKQNRLKLANDDLGRSLQAENAISIYEVTMAAKKAGASHVLILTVDRPLTAWVKIRLQCLTAEGVELWQEEAKNSGWFNTGASGVKGALKNLKTAVNKRLSKTPLPLENSSPPEKR